MTKLISIAVSSQNKLALCPWSQNEIVANTSPILWFGDVSLKKPKIVTIGINPSNCEFSCNNQMRPLKRPRIFGLQKWLNTKSNNVLEESFNHYFIGKTTNKANPYNNWFGKANGGKIEGFLNGLDASYYGSRACQAIHVDLFPFATLHKYRDLSLPCKFAMDKYYDVRKELSFLVKKIAPELIIVFGKSNIAEFVHYFHTDSISTPFFSSNSKKTSWYVCHSNLYTCPIVLLDLYLGNPKGWNINDLNSLGIEVKNCVKYPLLKI